MIRDGWSKVKVLGTITSFLFLVAVAGLLVFLPESGASQVLVKAFHLGWPGGSVIVVLLLYFQFGLKKDPDQNQLVFKSIVGLLGYSMLFIAIANYATNFNDESPGVPGAPRFLPVSFAILSVVCFTMAVYFQRVRVLLQIAGFMFFVVGSAAVFGNWLPQVKGIPPPEVKLVDVGQLSVQERVDLGERLIFGGLGRSETLGAIGKGQCPLCHGFQKEVPSERAPNLYGITKRAWERLRDPRYHFGKPNERDTIQKEAFPGSGTATTALEYIAESAVCPNCYVVSGFGVKGTNDRESPGEPLIGPPIELSICELIAIDTWLYVHDGKEPPSPSEIEKAYRKFIPESEWYKVADPPGSRLFRYCTWHGPKEASRS